MQGVVGSIPRNQVSDGLRDIPIDSLHHDASAESSSTQQQVSTTLPRLSATFSNTNTRKRKMTSSGTQGEDGDTQPLSPSVYAEHERMKKARKESWTGNEQSNGTNATTPRTYHTGDSGHIDLLAAFDRPDAIHPEDIEDLDGDATGDMSQIDVYAEIYPESERFQLPKTPATTGKKRDHHGEIIDSVSKTPHLPINPFAGQRRENIGLMGLSQAFNATQAASSPNPNMIPSDAPTERPSPAMHNAPRPSTADSFPSPARMSRTGPQRAVTEPQTVYISMKESQAERERLSKLYRNSSSRHGNTSSQESSEEEMESAENRARRRIIQRNIELETAKQFRAVTAQARPESRRPRVTSKASKGSPIRSPVVKASGSNTVIISDDLNADEEDDSTEDETEHEEEPSTPIAGSADELGDDNKENLDIRSGHGPWPTPRRSRNNNTHNEDVNSNQARQNHIRLLPVNYEMDELAAVDERHRGEVVDRVERFPRDTQMIAVADSQLSQSRGTQQITSLSKSALSATLSSPGSSAFVPQSQNGRLPNTSQIDSSMARQILETPSLNHSRSSPLSYHAKGSKTQGRTYSQPPVDSSPGPSSQTGINARRIANMTQTFDSSPPQVLRGMVSPCSEKNDTLSEIRARQVLHKAAEYPINHKHGGTSLQEVSSAVSRKEIGSTIDHSMVMHASNETPRNQSDALRSTIPETSSVVRHIQDSNSLALNMERDKNITSVAPNEMNAASDVRQEQYQSKPSTVFETAQSHMSESPSRSRVQHVLQVSQNSKSPSHARTSGVRMFNDIAANPSSSDAMGEVDLDVGVFTNEDMEFQSAIEASSPIGPARKRRRGYGGRPLRVSMQGHNPLSQQSSSSTEKQAVVDEQKQALIQSSGNAVIHEAREQTSVVGKVPPQEASEEGALPSLMANPASSKAATSALKAPKTISERPIQSPIFTSKLNDEEVHVGGKPASSKVSRDEQRAEKQASQASPPASSYTAPNRVFALFNGMTRGFYPATCIEVLNGSEPRCKVRFDDGTVGVLHEYCVRRLELQVGDTVKIDQPGLRSHGYVVKGFRDKELDVVVSGLDTPSRSTRRVSAANGKFPRTDVFGHKTVLVIPNKHAAAETVDVDAVALADIYLTQSMWPNFKSREFSFRPSLPISVSGLQTPSEQPSSPSSPSSRTRRLKSSVQFNLFGAPPKATIRSSSQLFNNVVFSVTNIEDNDTRERLAQQIRSHDGCLLDSSQGFEELFDIPDPKPALPYKRTSDIDETAFNLSHAAQRRGFTCLIADKHCRSVKFLQALALGIPCLATRWVTDCISKEELVPWEPYLLSSGESTFLNGAVRSRLLPPSFPNSILLPAIVASRPDFLKDCSVLLIIGKGKEAGIMKNYPFIAYALGAKKVCTVANLEEAKRAASEAKAAGDEWDWVYFYEDGKYDVRQAEKIIFGTTTSAGMGTTAAAGPGRPGRKRKRGSDGVVGGAGDNGKVIRRGKTRVVGTAFVVQSLILGMLIEE